MSEREEYVVSDSEQCGRSTNKKSGPLLATERANQFPPYIIWHKMFQKKVSINDNQTDCQVLWICPEYWVWNISKQVCPFIIQTHQNLRQWIYQICSMGNSTLRCNMCNIKGMCAAL